MKTKRSSSRVYRLEEAEVVRRSPPLPSTPLEHAIHGLRQFRREVEFNWNRAEHHVSVLLAQLRSKFETDVAKHIPQFDLPTKTRHAFAALSKRWRNSNSSPASLSIFQAEVKKRVSHIPVYVVAKQNGKLIFVRSDQDDEGQRPVGLVFLSATGARQLLTKVQRDVPEFAMEMEVICLDMGNLYDMLAESKASSRKNATFRFIPDAEQVDNAMEIVNQQRIIKKAFYGVPVFQVDGLVMPGEDRCRPVFLCKEDLDMAVALATKRKLERDRQALREQVEELKGEAQEARTLAKQSDGSDAERWISLAAKAETKARKIGKQLRDLPDSLSSLVRVEVGTLEDALRDIESNRTSSFGHTKIIPAGMTSHMSLNEPYESMTERKIVNLENRAA